MFVELGIVVIITGFIAGILNIMRSINSNNNEIIDYSNTLTITMITMLFGGLIVYSDKFLPELIKQEKPGEQPEETSEEIPSWSTSVVFVITIFICLMWYTQVKKTGIIDIFSFLLYILFMLSVIFENKAAITAVVILLFVLISQTHSNLSLILGSSSLISLPLIMN